MAPSRRRAQRANALAIALLLLAAACAGGTGGPSPSPEVSGTSVSRPTPNPSSEGSPDATETPSASETDRETETETEAQSRGVIAWILSLGPGAPSGPGDFRAYYALRERRCQDLLDQMRDEEPDEPGRSLYTGAAHACLAATQGRDDLLADAQAARDRVAARSDEFSCLERATFELLERLLVASAEHPDGLDIAPDSDAEPPPCPTIDRLEPASGPSGTVVTLHGSHLADVSIAVHHGDDEGRAPDDEPVPTSQDDGSVVFSLDADGHEGPVCVVVVTEPDGWSADGAVFTVETTATTTEEGPGTEVSPEPSDDVTAAAAVQDGLACPPPPGA